jgi:hypothetical protein
MQDAGNRPVPPGTNVSHRQRLDVLVRLGGDVAGGSAPSGVGKAFLDSFATMLRHEELRR